jgi:hypothetical protein
VVQINQRKRPPQAKFSEARNASEECWAKSRFNGALDFSTFSPAQAEGFRHSVKVIAASGCECPAFRSDFDQRHGRWHNLGHRRVVGIMGIGWLKEPIGDRSAGSKEPLYVARREPVIRYFHFKINV